jgi:hypothetical protein
VTTENAMQERRGSDELRRLRTENTLLMDHNKRMQDTICAMIDELNSTRTEIARVKEKTADMVEACAVVADGMTEKAVKGSELADNAQDRALCDERARAYRTVALMIRRLR